MLSTSGPRLRRGLRRRAGVATTALATAAVVAGLTTSPAASLSPSAQCPLPYPVSQVAKGQRVSGLTVTSGTTPERFSGEILGVIQDGIAPGLDMVMARLTSPEIDRVGIWEGMSGSPVYAENGNLIGAVAYGLASGPSPVAGITPAAEMYRLLSTAPQDPSSRSTLGVADGNQSVRIPRAMATRLTSSGVARAAARPGMTRLPLPFGISGMVNAKRLRQAARALDLSGVHVHQGGAVGASRKRVPVVAGGNLAASLSYGDVSAIGVGTATAVCGDQVIAFGHPMSFTGASQMTMHGAEAVYIQEDPLGPGFKMANPTAPVGSITKDRLAGLFGVQRADAVPATTVVTSYVEVPGEWSRQGTTRISAPDTVPDIAAFHLLADEDRVFDGVGGGSATVGWRILGRRADGRPFTLARTDRFAATSDLSYATVLDLYDALATVRFNDAEEVSIDRIRTTSTMSRTYRAYEVAQVRVLVRGRWRELRTDEPLFLRPGSTERLRVRLTSRILPPRWVRVDLPVPAGTGTKSGMLQVVGGNSVEGQDGSFDEDAYTAQQTKAPATFEQVLGRLRRAPRNDQVVATLALFRRDGTTRKVSARATVRAVVDGSMNAPVQGLGRPWAHRGFGR
jgi:hypothetical protein